MTSLTFVDFQWRTCILGAPILSYCLTLVQGLARMDPEHNRRVNMDTDSNTSPESVQKQQKALAWLLKTTEATKAESFTHGALAVPRWHGIPFNQNDNFLKTEGVSFQDFMELIMLAKSVNEIIFYSYDDFQELLEASFDSERAKELAADLWTRININYKPAAKKILDMAGVNMKFQF